MITEIKQQSKKNFIRKINEFAVEFINAVQEKPENVKEENYKFITEIFRRLPRNRTRNEARFFMSVAIKSVESIEEDRADREQTLKNFGELMDAEEDKEKTQLSNQPEPKEITEEEVQNLLKELNQASKMTVSRKEEIEQQINQWINKNGSAEQFEYEFADVLEVRKKLDDILTKKYNPITINQVARALLSMFVASPEHLELVKYCVENSIRDSGWELIQNLYCDRKREMEENLEEVQKQGAIFTQKKEFIKFMKIARDMKEHQTTKFEIWTPKKQ